MGESSDRRWGKVEDARAILKCSRAEVIRLRQEGKLPVKRIGPWNRIDLAAARELARERGI